MNLEELTPREQRLIKAHRRFSALWSSRHVWWAIGASFALNTLGMAATSGGDGLDLWIGSGLQAVVMTSLCIVPGIIAYGLSVTNRPHRWTVAAAWLIAVGNIASAVAGGLSKT